MPRENIRVLLSAGRSSMRLLFSISLVWCAFVARNVHCQTLTEILKYANIEDYDILPSLMSSAQRLQVVDPYRLIRGLDHELGNGTLNQDSDWERRLLELEDPYVLNLPENVPQHHLDEVRALRAFDTGGVLDTLLSGLFPGRSFDPTESDRAIMAVIAAITPVLNVSEECHDQSMGYVLSLVRAQPWAIFMLDSNGKLPDGVFSDTSTICDYLHYFDPDNCDYMDLKFRALFEFFAIPRGNTKAFGSFQGCLAVDAPSSEGEKLGPFFKWDAFKGKYAYLSLVALNPFEGLDLNFTLPDNFMYDFERISNPDERMAFILVVIKYILNLVSEGLDPNIVTTALFKIIRYMYILLMQVHWGQCVPDACTNKDIRSNYNELYRDLGAAVQIVSAETKQSQDDIKDVSDSTSIGVITLFSVIAFLMLCGLLVELYQRFFSSRGDSIVVPEEEPFIFTLLKCFSPYQNGRKLLNSDAPKGNSHLSCLSGIRVISMTWVVLGHVYLTVSLYQVSNPMTVYNEVSGIDSSLAFEVIMNALPSVDTFFFMSGLLVAYFSFIELEKKRFNLALFYIHRYLRLTIPFALAIGFVAALQPHMGSGPLWNVAELNPANCRQNWWVNLLYLHNFVHQDHLCLGQTWYMADDMQYFWVSPLIFLPMFYWGTKKHNHWGLWWWALWMVAATVTPIAIVIAYDLPPTHVFLTETADNEDFDMEAMFYERPYIRMQPYLIGMLLGYILWKLKDKEVKIHWFTNLVLWICAIATGVAVIFGLYSLRHSNLYYECSASMFESAFYNGFHRIGWGLALSWVTFACIKGYGGIVNSILSWSPFLPMARLSYMVYLLHLDFMVMFFFSMTFTIEATHVIVSYYIVGLVMIIFAAAIPATLTIEAPFINLEKLLITKFLRKPKRPVKTQIEETKEELIEESPKGVETSENVPPEVESKHPEKLEE